jgi:hypothetical protein
MGDLTFLFTAPSMSCLAVVVVVAVVVAVRYSGG